MTATLGNVIQTTPTFTATAIAGSSTTGTIFLRAFIGNWVGVNEPSAEQSIALTASQGIQITIPTTYRRDSDQPDYVVIEGTTTSGSNYRVMAVIPLKTTTGADIALPLSVNLTSAIEVDPNATVPDLVALSALAVPTNGKMVFVTSESAYYQYFDPFPLETAGTSIIQSASTGLWVKQQDSTVFVVDTTQQGGAFSSPLTSEQKIPVPYDEDSTESYPITLLFRNGLDANQADIPLGTKLQLIPYLDGSPAASLLNGLVKVQLLGYARLDGSFTAIPSPQVLFDATRNDLIALPQTLPSGDAAVYSVVLQYAATQLPNINAFSCVAFTIQPYAQGGILAPWTQFTGNFASPDGDARRALPDVGLTVRVGEGAVAVEGLASGVLGETTLSPFVASTPNQQTVIDGNGIPRIATTPSEFETEFALIGTLPGNTRLINAGEITFAAAAGVQVDFTNPTDGLGEGTIRDDYPDTSIAGRIGAFNPTEFTIYLEQGGTFYQTDFLTPTSNGTVSETVSSLGTVATPSSPAVDFGFYDPSPVALTEVAGSIPAGTYVVYLAYQYDGSAISSINNQLDIFGETTPDIDVSIIEIQRIDNSTSTFTTVAQRTHVGGTTDHDIFLDDVPAVGQVREIRNLTPSTATYQVLFNTVPIATLGDSGDGVHLRAIYDGVEWVGEVI